MPKEIKTAAEILGESAPESAEATPAQEIPSSPPPEPVAPSEEVSVAEPAQAGFESPPPEESSTNAAQVLTASGSLAQQAPPPPTAVATQSKEAVIPARPETIAGTDEEVIEAPAKVIPGVKTEWRFVKNHQFGERIILKDGTELKYKSALIVVRDPALAAKVLEVAKQYCIVEQ
jgi:hypothetical protein